MVWTGRNRTLDAEPSSLRAKGYLQRFRVRLRERPPEVLAFGTFSAVTLFLDDWGRGFGTVRSFS